MKPAQVATTTLTNVPLCSNISFKVKPLATNATTKLLVSITHP